jgi:hypothetical protein
VGLGSLRIPVCRQAGWFNEMFKSFPILKSKKAGSIFKRAWLII